MGVFLVLVGGFFVYTVYGFFFVFRWFGLGFWLCFDGFGLKFLFFMGLKFYSFKFGVEIAVVGWRLRFFIFRNSL